MKQPNSSPSSLPRMRDFTPKADGYVPRNAYWLASCANLAYKKPDDIRKQAKEWGLTQFQFLGETEDLEVEKAASQLLAGKGWTLLEGAGTEGFVVGNNKFVIVSFRGTEELTDFVADARANQVPDVGKRGKLHSGFAAAFSESVSTELKKAVSNLTKEGQGIWVTGHSLGGALATLAAAELTFAGLKLQGVYTFGQPRVCDPHFAEAYDKELGDRHFRFVNNNDIVTNVPPESVTIRKHVLSYRHVGQRIYIKTSGQLTDDISRLELTVDRVVGRVQAALERDFTDGVSDHGMVHYLTALEQNYTVDPTAEGVVSPRGDQGGGFLDPPVPEPLEVARKTEDDLDRLLAEHPVEFASNSTELTARGRESLDKAARLLSGAPVARFRIEGHTDAQDTAQRNLDLSRRRADAVLSYLTDAGLDAKRFETEGFGESQPVASNDTPEGRQLNRRVEIRLLEEKTP